MKERKDRNKWWWWWWKERKSRVKQRYKETEKRISRM